jgi:hypothetical protein
VPLRRRLERAHAFVTAQGSALTRYRRALDRRHIFGAEIAAKEMGYGSLRDALGLLALYAAEESPKYVRAATGWLGRLALESDVEQTSAITDPVVEVCTSLGGASSQAARGLSLRWWGSQRAGPSGTPPALSPRRNAAERAGTYPGQTCAGSAESRAVEMPNLLTFRPVESW